MFFFSFFDRTLKILCAIVFEHSYLRGATTFQELIFYLRTDVDEICTAYVKLNSKIFFVHGTFLDFGMVFDKI